MGIAQSKYCVKIGISWFFKANFRVSITSRLSFRVTCEILKLAGWTIPRERKIDPNRHKLTPRIVSTLLESIRYNLTEI